MITGKTRICLNQDNILLVTFFFLFCAKTKLYSVTIKQINILFKFLSKIVVNEAVILIKEVLKYY